MMGFQFADSAGLMLQAGVWLICGVLLGAGYFLMLRWNVTLLALGRAPLAALLLQFARLVVLGAALAVIVSRFGAMPLLLATAGILAARMAAIRMGEQR